MDWLSTISSILILSGVFFAGLATLMERFPPRHINLFYGYKTPRSMASQEAWDFAQDYAAFVMGRTGRILFLLGAFWLFMPRFSETTEVFISVSVVVAALLHVVLETERQLKDKFGR